jgi:hypothetical protein
MKTGGTLPRCIASIHRNQVARLKETGDAPLLTWRFVRPGVIKTRLAIRPASTIKFELGCRAVGRWSIKPILLEPPVT